MGNEMSHGHEHGNHSNAHGHSHGGKPCHGHGSQPNPNRHNHGHGHQQPQQPAQAHGHSHGGKPCHGHGQPPPPQHGHSHGGKPCHGHGGQAHGHGHSHGATPNSALNPNQVEAIKKEKGAQLFMNTMLKPKLPIVWASIVSRDGRNDELSTKSGGFIVPHVISESMNRAELRTFIERFLTAQSQADGINMYRIIQALQLELTLLRILQFDAAANDPTADVSIPYDKMAPIIESLFSRVISQRSDALPYLMAQFGLGTLKLPTLPTTISERQQIASRQYIHQHVTAQLLAWLRQQQDINQNNDNAAIAAGFIPLLQSLVTGLERAHTQMKIDLSHEEYEKVNTMIPLYLEEIISLIDGANEHPDDALAPLRTHPSSPTIYPEFLLVEVTEVLLIPLLIAEPHVMAYIAAEWGIELNITPEMMGESATTATATAKQPQQQSLPSQQQLDIDSNTVQKAISLLSLQNKPQSPQ